MFPFSLTSLGSASALPTKEQYPTAHALNLRGRFFLLDCGEGTQMQCCRHGISLLAIESLFITHLHGDHIFGLPGLLSTYRLLGRTRPLDIYAPEALGPLLDAFLNYTGKDMPFSLTFHPLDGCSLQKIADASFFEVFAFPLDHSMPTYAYLFREKPALLNIRKELVQELGLSIPQIRSLKEGKDIVSSDGSLLLCSQVCYPSTTPRSLAYCTDTAYCPQIIPYIKGVDCLFHEATYLSDALDKASAYRHSTAAQAAQIAKEAEVGHLLLGHFSSRYKDLQDFSKEACQIFPNTSLSIEGTQFAIPQIKL